MALSLRASTAVRDTRPSGARKRAPCDHVSRPSRRGPPQQRYADCGFPEEGASWGAANPKSEIRNPKLAFGRIWYTMPDEWAFIS